VGKVSIDGGEMTQVTDSFTAYPSVSPDGKLIACLYAEDLSQVNWRIAVLPVAGGRPIKVFPQSVSTQIVRWAPDGRSLTYAENPPAGASKLWLQPLDGGAPKQLAEFATDVIFGFDWSRDGQYLACVRGLWATNVILIQDFR
jgi:Tol biopolymer transport system component